MNKLSGKGLLFFLLLIFLIISAKATYAAGDTLHVVTHKRVTVVTDPAKGTKTYKAWGRFPAAKEGIRSITLNVRFGCPDGMRCADWDYKDHITIRRTGGVKGASQDYEIGRMLTPYGGAFAKDWSFNWEVDVTDFSLLLRDSVEIEYNHVGWEPNQDRGWSVTLDFELVKGRPAWEPISIQKIYDGSFRYGDKANSIEKMLKPVDFMADKQADFARLRVVQTGHGMDKPDGCGEFCDKYRELWYDGKMIDKRPIWKKCGDNPLYPQAGTWVYDRANWCPGNLMQPDLYNLPVQGSRRHTIDLTMEPYTASSEPSADEVISAYLIQYKKAPTQHDVALEAIVRPSLKDVYQRDNPAAMQPRLVVKNMGAGPVSSLMVRYGTLGAPLQQHRWQGSLAPGASTVIDLPGVIGGQAARNTFVAELLRPNGKRDQYAADNRQTSPYAAVPTHAGNMVVYLQTNNQSAQNSYTLTDSQGKVWQRRALGTLKNNTLYRDTLHLPEGRYRLVMLDSAGNGLEFWANSRGGRGKLRLLNADGAMLKDFESDFGSSVVYDFRVGQPVAPITAQTSFGLYPTSTNGPTTLDYYANFPEDVVVQLVTDPGDAVVEEHRYPRLQEGTFAYDLSRFPKGRFYLKVLINGQERFKKRLRLKER
ncbi:peptide-N-glycosidase (plasmid) [Hymenobacter sp. NBH84]|uniref:peptide-N-glycosidase F-related protein n=1 Tax=Hymenobacter sp. NBH84 TaxID=2596915 RepID=UPI001628141B|nr:peptide-N-glycosidase F-related protein [Hymenobacter sp. NBH84]QNE41951.1 peptide-N-glycosidase [Hymenobacter sp. NBH84]